MSEEGELFKEEIMDVEGGEEGNCERMFNILGLKVARFEIEN